MGYSSRICNQNLHLTKCKSKWLKYSKYQPEIQKYQKQAGFTSSSQDGQKMIPIPFT